MTATITSTGTRTRLRLLLAGAGAAAALGLLSGCSTPVPAVGHPGQTPVRPGQTPIVVVPGQINQPVQNPAQNPVQQADVSDPNADLHLLSSGNDNNQDAQDMSGWYHYVKPTTSGFVPDDHWNVVDSHSGVDISSPVGDAGGSLVWVTGALSTISNEQANAMFLQSFSDLHVDAQDQPYQTSAGSMRQDTVYTGTISGSVVHGVLTTDVFNDDATGAHGLSAKMAQSKPELWSQDRRALQLIVTHIAITGSMG